jgi:RNA polymerase sigma-70 factor (ECF subfamily)
LDVDALFRAHAGFVAGFLVRLGIRGQDVDDLVQEVFIVAHRRGGFVEGVGKPTTWLAQISLRVALRRRRVWRRHEAPLVGEDAVPEPEAKGANPLDAAAATQSLERVQQALDTLDLDHRAVFILFELEGEPCDAIAGGLGIPVGTVYSRLHAARRQFRKAYDRITDPHDLPSVEAT